MNNFAKRTVSGTLFVALTVACLLSRYAFVVFFALVMAAMLYEYYSMTLGTTLRAARRLAGLTGLTLLTLVYLHAGYSMPAKWISLTLIPLLAVMAGAVCARDKDGVDSLSHVFSGLVYIALPTALSPLLVFRGGDFSGLTLLSFFIILWCADVGAYCVGTALGQKPTSRKLCPEISPKKSWVGVFGGLVMAVAAALVLHWCGLLAVGTGHSVILAVIIMVGGVFGDLYESLWKRHYGLKDSGDIIPGHGGVLDRFDSSLIAIPLGAIYLALAV